jgi:hypothetical protein
LPGHSRFVPMNVHRLRYMIHTCCIQLNPKNYHVSHLCLRCARFSDQEIIMEKDKTYVKNILDPEFSEDDHSVSSSVPWDPNVDGYTPLICVSPRYLDEA